MNAYYFIIAIISAILFGVSTPISKYLLGYFNEFQLAGLLYIGAAIGTLPMIVAKWKDGPLKIKDRKNQKYVLGSIVFGGILGTLFLLFGLGFSKASSVSLWLNLELVATSILGVLFFRDHLDKKTWVGILITLSAGILLTLDDGNTGLIAIILVAFACICWGLDNHFTSLIDKFNVYQVTFVKGAIAGTTNLLIGTIISGKIPQIYFVLGAVLVGIFAYGLSIVLYIKASHHLGATRSQVVFSSAPFFGFISSWVLLSERVGIIQICSAILMLIAIWIISKNAHEHHHVHDEIEHIHSHLHDDEHHTHEHFSNTKKRHTHKHKHKKEEHSHIHYPDLHHRHDH